VLLSVDLRALIRRMSVENLLWGAPRIHGELLKLGFAVAQSSVAKYMANVQMRLSDAPAWLDSQLKRRYLVLRSLLRRHLRRGPAIARLALRPRHFINYNVVVSSTIEFDQRRNGTRLHHRFVGVGSCKSANSVHGLPSCEDEKFNLVAKVPPTQMRPDKPRNFAQLGHNFFAKVPWIRIRIRWTRACTPLAEDHGVIFPSSMAKRNGLTSIFCHTFCLT